MATSDQIWIKSTRFEIEPGEDSLTNPGIYGKQLADWLADQLKDAGESIADVIPEDWGWCIVLRRSPLSFVGCANRWGAVDEWGTFADIRESFFGKFSRDQSAAREVQRLQDLLKGILSSSSPTRLWIER